MKKTSATIIGAFVLGAIALLILSILMFSKQRFFESAEQKVAYFDASVNGLGVGAPVKLKGVTIGSVTRVALNFKVDELEFHTAVFFELPARHLMEMVTDKSIPKDEVDLIIEQLIHEKGLRAQLMPQSLVTGQLYLGLDFFPDTEARFYGGFKNIPEIPGIPSSTDQIVESITDGITHINELPLKEIASQALSTLQTLEQAINPKELSETLKALQTTLNDIDHTVQTVDQRLGPMTDSFEKTLLETRSLVGHVDKRVDDVGLHADQSLIELQHTLKLAQSSLRQFKEGSAVSVQLSETLVELSSAARSVRFLADELRQQPQALLFGKESGASE